MHDVTLVIKAESEQAALESLALRGIDARLIDFNRRYCSATCYAKVDSMLPIVSWFNEDINIKPTPMGGLLWYRYDM
jgi:hypothetical protein